MKVKQSNFKRGVVLTLAGAILWGLSGTCIQFLLSHYNISPNYITFIRTLGSAILFLIVLMVKKRDIVVSMVRDRQVLSQVVVYAIFGILALQITFTTTIKYSNAGTATVLQCLGIALVVIYTCLKSRRLPRPHELIGITLALGSTFILATHGNPAVLVLPLFGIFWGLACAFSQAVYLIYPRRLLQKWDSFTVVGLGMAAATLPAFLIAQPWSVSLDLDGTGIAVLGIVILFGTFGAYALFLQGIADVGSVPASMLSAIEPVAATFFSWLWLGTQLPLIDYFAFAMMIIMVLIVSSKKNTVEKSSQGLSVVARRHQDMGDKKK